jgi:heme/copper-type cytochrome/quinol oxidase subunit 2
MWICGGQRTTRSYGVNEYMIIMMMMIIIIVIIIIIISIIIITIIQFFAYLYANSTIQNPIIKHKQEKENKHK